VPAVRLAIRPPGLPGRAGLLRRYGHHATFLREELQPTAADLDFAESAVDRDQFRHSLAIIKTAA
jgi:hypothetical protein